MKVTNVEFTHSRRITAYIKKELYEKLRRWRFKNEINSESEAIEKLIGLALQEDLKPKNKES